MAKKNHEHRSLHRRRPPNFFGLDEVPVKELDERYRFLAFDEDYEIDEVEANDDPDDEVEADD